MPRTPSPIDDDMVEHPFWCDLSHCRAEPFGGREHRSTPVTEHAERDDVALSMAYCRYDEPGETGEEGWLVTMCNTAVDEMSSAFFTDRDLDKIPVMRFKLRTMLAGGQIVDTTATTELPVVTSGG
jgi:hypothetical protein